MKLLFLGVFSFMAVGKDVFQSNMLIESENGQKMLIDCGTDIRHSLFAQGYTHKDIDAVYISHLHSDHIGGLEWLGFSNFFRENRRLALYISPDQQLKLWQNALSAGMSTLENEEAKLETFFHVKDIENNGFYWNECHFELIKTYHTVDNQDFLPTYGVFIRTNKNKIFVTTDTRFVPEHFMPFYEDADVIFQDCEVVDFNSQHANYKELVKLDGAVKKKMWLYGYSNIKLPNASKDGFKGFIKQGQLFTFN